MTEIPQGLHTMPTAVEELFRDARGSAAEQRIMALVRAMEEDGTPIRTIARAMLCALCWIAQGEYMKWDRHRLWAKHFIRQAGSRLTQWVEDTDHAEDLIDARMRSQDAGGTGNPFQ